MLGWMTADSADGRFRWQQKVKTSAESKAAAKKLAEPTASSWNKEKAGGREERETRKH